MYSKNEFPRNIIGGRVKIAREKFIPLMTQNDLSARLEVRGVELSRSAIARIEARNRPITDIQLVAFADVLGVSVDWLLGLI
jgi:HTH-type transcriptional regulator, cell division transcriptional repressor